MFARAKWKGVVSKFVISTYHMKGLENIELFSPKYCTSILLYY